jgi:hypothetical protein
LNNAQYTTNANEHREIINKRHQSPASTSPISRCSSQTNLLLLRPGHEYLCDIHLPVFNDMAVIALPRNSPCEDESAPPSRMSLSADHQPTAGNLSPTDSRANSLPVRVPCALQRRCTWPPSAAASADDGSNQEEYFMAKSLKMYNRLLAAGLNVINVNSLLVIFSFAPTWLRCLPILF